MAPPMLNHTMFRIKDKDVSLDFYTRILGMELLDSMDGGDFHNYFLGFPEEGKDLTAEQKKATKTARQGVLELCHNHGTESDPEFKGYANGNSEPGRGFGHIAISVDDVEKEQERLLALGVKFKKLTTDGKMRHIAFALDPDGYWLEIVPNRL
ncbi:Glyoxalase/Bleomycin resistance protein/Dihydroxybiphenyl dioxygenase [Leucosporidium creatinivorum]|uniref:Lactoylglutathione lyase n=1 Tax=Leucosporidium creatinivorum TaxID=106004 RepID=A0A1Y2DH06_9BASI|nr:Glyoxalase/Bleomycin resistance protein/Dihydroxybiphenyl dioxygenase [Leucosporidium creatinivorum]